MPSPFVIDVTEQSFQAEVIEASMDLPILVDFWAEWCAPCKEYGPILERLADEYNGAFRVAKVDTEAERGLASAFQVQSIPTTAIVFGGQILDSFPGALPEADLRRMLDGLFEQLGVKVQKADKGPPSDPEGAAGYWRARLDKSPVDGEALLELARLEVQSGELESAKVRFQKIEAVMDQYGAAQAALATLGLLGEVAEAGGEAAVRAGLARTPEDARLQYLVACADASRGDFATGLATLVELVGRGPEDVAADAKSAAAVVFEAAGREDAEVEQLRRQLARLLF